MNPIIFVAVQLAVLAGTYFAHLRHQTSLVFRSLWLALIGGVIGMDVWYFANFAYPAGFAW